MNDVIFVVELCYNHAGDISKALQIIDDFHFCDVFKFQKMNPKKFLSDEQYVAKTPETPHYFAEIYGKHREFVELSIEDHQFLKKYIEIKGKQYACSVCDIDSAKEIIPLNPAYIKIPSCRCHNFNLLKYVIENFSGQLHISTGMTTKLEQSIVKRYAPSAIFYSCTSDYSNEKKSEIFLSRDAGFSCHTPDIFFAQAAILNGAKYIEYHCTIDRNWPGSDNRISLLSAEYENLFCWYHNNQQKINRIRYERLDEISLYEQAARDKLWGYEDNG